MTREEAAALLRQPARVTLGRKERDAIADLLDPQRDGLQPVRIAVALNSADDEWGCCVIASPNTDDQIFDELEFDGCTRHQTIVTAYIPIRPVAQVEGGVE